MTIERDSLAAMMAADFDDRPRSVAMELIDRALAEGRRAGPSETIQEAWVEDGSRDGGHWERVQ